MRRPEPGATDDGYETALPVSMLESSRIVLKPIVPADTPFLYDLELHPDTGFRWRFRGQTPSPDQFVRSLFEGVLATFVVVGRSAARRIGVVTVYDADFVAGRASLAAACVKDVRGTGVMIEAIGLLVEYVFTTWPLRKLYAETIEFNLRQFPSAIRWLFDEEGRLRDYEYYDGQFWDKHILSLSREQWRRYRRFLFDEPSDRAGLQFGTVNSVADLSRILATVLERPPEDVRASTQFSELGLDSLEWFALAAIIEDIAEARLPEGLFPQIHTVDDAYAWIAQRQRD